MIEQTALEKFVECGGWDEVDPVERLRFFCSLAMVGQDWLDVEQFIDDIKKALERGGIQIGCMLSGELLLAVNAGQAIQVDSQTNSSLVDRDDGLMKSTAGAIALH